MSATDTLSSPQENTEFRILYFYQYFGTPRGSWSTRVYEFARRWIQQGAAVTVVTTPYDKSDLEADRFLEHQEIDGISLRVIKTRNSNQDPLLIRLLSFVLYALVAAFYAVTAKADVVVASSGPLFVGIPGLLAKWFRGRTFVFEVRDLWPEGAIQLGILTNPILIRLARWFEALCYRHADAVIALSPGMAEWIQRRCPNARVHTIPNAADNALAEEVLNCGGRPSDCPKGKHLVLYTGSLGTVHDSMQLVHLAEALQAIGADDVAIAVLGDGKDRPAMERAIQQQRLPNIFLFGNRPKTEVFSWLAIADCALLTTKPVPVLDTASPNKVFDAWAMGVPVVQTTQGWLKQLIQQSDTGLTVPPGDPQAMAAAILSLTRDPARRATMRLNARRLAKAEFDRDFLANRMLFALRETHTQRCKKDSRS